jgi:predicted RNA-binding protein YlqC (UPF0109 family)
MRSFLGAVARSLVDEPDSVRVLEKVEGTLVRLDLEVAAHDRGRVIGRSGRTAEALRTLLGVIARRRGLRCRLEIP